MAFSISFKCEWLYFGRGFTFVKIATHVCEIHPWALQIDFMGFGVELGFVNPPIVEKIIKSIKDNEHD